MFSVIFPGQGSQKVGMGKEFYNKFDFVKEFLLCAIQIALFEIGYDIFVDC